MRFDRPSRRASRLRLFLLVSLLLGLAWLAMAFFRVGTAPAIEITAERGGIGREPSPITVNVEAPSRGLEDVRVELLQGGRSESLAEATFKPRAFWAFWGPRTQAHRFTLPIGQSEHTDLEEGEATIRVVASRAGSWLRHPEPTTTELSVPVRLKPPILSVESRPNIARQGGSGLLLYRVGEAALEEGGADGVEVGSWFFSGRPLPGADDPTQRFCLFALPYDLESGEVPKLAARDALGNSSSRTFLDTFQAAPLRYDEINISDSFLDKVVPEILEQTPSLGDKGSRIENYLAINGGLRAKNANQLIELARASSPERLWQGAFLQLPSSQVTSTFADRRTYSYQGREVDRQDHLGYDLGRSRCGDRRRLK